MKKILLVLGVMLLVTIALSLNLLAYTINPINDALVTSRYPEAGDNYGDDGELVASCINIAQEFYVLRTYIQFDISSIPASEQITGATLNLYHYIGYGDYVSGVHVHYLSNDSWNESGITWMNRPDLGITIPEISSNSNTPSDVLAWSSRVV